VIRGFGRRRGMVRSFARERDVTRSFANGRNRGSSSYTDEGKSNKAPERSELHEMRELTMIIMLAAKSLPSLLFGG